MSNHRLAILDLHCPEKLQCDIVNLHGRISPQKLVDVRNLAMKVIVQNKDEISLPKRRRFEIIKKQKIPNPGFP